MKHFLSKWQQRINGRLLRWNQRSNDLFDRLYDRIAAYMEHREIKQHSFREFALEDELNKVRSDNKYLRLQLTKTRADLYELQRRPQELRDVISGIFLMTNEKLREISRFPVRKSESGEAWETVTGSCCLGGCDMDVYPFQSERDALLFSVLLKAVGYQSPHNIACEKCYQEYMSEQTEGGIDIYAE